MIHLVGLPSTVRTKVTHRVVSALAFGVDLSVDETMIRGQGKSMPNLHRKTSVAPSVLKSINWLSVYFLFVPLFIY